MHLHRVVTTEINGAHDNPVVTADGFHCNNNANFDGTLLSITLDALVGAALAAATQSERRTARLLSAHESNGLPAFLISPQATPGVDSGMMMAQVETYFFDLF